MGKARLGVKGSPSRKRRRADAKQVRTDNVRWIIEHCFANNMASAYRYFGISEPGAGDGVGERRARIIEGRLRLAIGLLEREDFQEIFGSRGLRVPATPGEAWSTMDMALVRAARIQLLARLGFGMKDATRTGSRLGAYINPTKVGGGVANGLPAAEARAFEQELGLPAMFFDIPLTAEDLRQAVQTAIQATVRPHGFRAAERRRGSAVALPVSPYLEGPASTCFWGKDRVLEKPLREPEPA